MHGDLPRDEQAMMRCRMMKCVPGDDTLSLPAARRLEAAGLRPGKETRVVNMPQINRHQPEGHSGILDGRELEAHTVVDVH